MQTPFCPGAPFFLPEACFFLLPDAASSQESGQALTGGFADGFSCAGKAGSGASVAKRKRASMVLRSLLQKSQGCRTAETVRSQDATIESSPSLLPAPGAHQYGACPSESGF